MCSIEHAHVDFQVPLARVAAISSQILMARTLSLCRYLSLSPFLFLCLSLSLSLLLFSLAYDIAGITTFAPPHVDDVAFLDLRPDEELFRIYIYIYI